MHPTTAFRFAVALRADHWVPAHGGTEQPFVSRSGRRLLYCFNPRRGRHAYLDLSSDIILTDDEAHDALQLF